MVYRTGPWPALGTARTPVRVDPTFNRVPNDYNKQQAGSTRAYLNLSMIEF